MRSSNFVVFLFLCFAITVPLFLFAAQQSSPVLTVAISLGGSYVPAAAAWWAVRRETDAVQQDFRRSLRGWAGGRWIGLALVLPSLIWLGAYGGLLLLGRRVEPAWVALAALPIIFLVNYGEEVGWRGYALPYLLGRFQPLAASLILGVIWALFHAALYWHRPLFGGLASMVIFLMSFILAWMFLQTRRLLPGTLLHAAFNAWTQVFAAGPHAELALGIVIVLLALMAGTLLISRPGKVVAVQP